VVIILCRPYDWQQQHVPSVRLISWRSLARQVLPFGTFPLLATTSRFRRLRLLLLWSGSRTGVGWRRTSRWLRCGHRCAGFRRTDGAVGWRRWWRLACVSVTIILYTSLWQPFNTVGGVLQLLGRRSGWRTFPDPCLIYGWHVTTYEKSVRYGSVNQANLAFHPFGVGKWVVIHVIT